MVHKVLALFQKVVFAALISTPSWNGSTSNPRKSQASVTSAIPGKYQPENWWICPTGTALAPLTVDIMPRTSKICERSWLMFATSRFASSKPTLMPTSQSKPCYCCSWSMVRRACLLSLYVLLGSAMMPTRRDVFVAIAAGTAFASSCGEHPVELRRRALVKFRRLDLGAVKSLGQSDSALQLPSEF